jgi:hypothetical protein
MGGHLIYYWARCSVVADCNFPGVIENVPFKAYTFGCMIYERVDDPFTDVFDIYEAYKKLGIPFVMPDCIDRWCHSWMVNHPLSGVPFNITASFSDSVSGFRGVHQTMPVCAVSHE